MKQFIETRFTYNLFDIISERENII